MREGKTWEEGYPGERWKKDTETLRDEFDYRYCVKLCKKRKMHAIIRE